MAKKTFKIDPFRDSGYTPDAAGKPAKIALNQGPSTPIRIDTHVDGYGNKSKKVLHDFGAGRIGKIRPKKGKV